MELTKQRRILLLTVVISAIAIISVQVVASSLLVSNVEYGTSLVLVRGIDGSVLGTTQGLVFYSNYTNGGAEVQLWTVNATDYSTRMIADFPTGAYGYLGSMTFDSNSNLYYGVEFTNATELIVTQLWASRAFASPKTIYKDNPCSLPANASSCTSGISDIAASPSGTVYFLEDFLHSSVPAGNGTSEIKEIVPGASHATTLVSLNSGKNVITEMVFATKYLYFAYSTPPTTQLERFVLKSGTYSSVASFQNVPANDVFQANASQVSIASSPPVGGVVKSVYYFYRLSRGPFDPAGVKSAVSPAPAEAVVGKVAASASSCKVTASTGSPCGMKSETLTSPESFLFFQSTSYLQVDSSGDVFEVVLPYSTHGLTATGTAVLQWYNPATGKFTELASEMYAEPSGIANSLTFTLDSSGNLYYLYTGTGSGALIEILRV